MEFSVEGLALPGKVEIPLRDLVWRPDPKPDDPDEEDFLPDAPGSFIAGWFPLAPAAPLEEGQEFPDKAEVYIRLEISELLLPKEELDALNIVTLTLHSIHRLPPLWGPTPETAGENHDYLYKLRYSLPGTEPDSVIDIKVDSGEILAPDPDPEPSGEPAAEGEGGGGGDGVEGAFEPEAGEEAPAQSDERGDDAQAAPEEADAYVQRTGSRVVVVQEKTGPRIMVCICFRFGLSPWIVPSESA